MKKLLLSSFLATSMFALAYTQVDIENANYLSGKSIIKAQSSATKYRLDDTITRAEVIGIAMKMKWENLPKDYTCKKYFTDVVKNDWICRAVELGAKAGIVSRENARFRPLDPITRVEALAILMNSMGTRWEETVISPFPFTDVKKWTWEEKWISRAYTLNIITEVPCDSSWDARTCSGVSFGQFRPTSNATRAELFEFAKNTYTYGVSIGLVWNPESAFLSYSYSYTTDENYVYKNNNIVPNIDPSSFRINLKDFIEDKDGVYKYDATSNMAYKVTWIDKESMKILNYNYIKDAYNVYLCTNYDEAYECRILPNIDVASFSCYDLEKYGNLCKDNYHQYDLAGKEQNIDSEIWPNNL